MSKTALLPFYTWIQDSSTSANLKTTTEAIVFSKTNTMSTCFKTKQWLEGFFPPFYGRQHLVKVKNQMNTRGQIQDACLEFKHAGVCKIISFIVLYSLQFVAATHVCRKYMILVFLKMANCECNNSMTLTLRRGNIKWKTKTYYL